MERFQIQQNKIMRFTLNKGYDTLVAEMIENLDSINVKHFEIN